MSFDHEEALRMAISKLGFLESTINIMTSRGNPYTCEFLESIGETRALGYIIDSARDEILKVYASLFPDMEDEEEMGLEWARKELAAEESKPAAGLDERRRALEAGSERSPMGQEIKERVDAFFDKGFKRFLEEAKAYEADLRAEAMCEEAPGHEPAAADGQGLDG